MAKKRATKKRATSKAPPASSRKAAPRALKKKAPTKKAPKSAVRKKPAHAVKKAKTAPKPTSAAQRLTGTPEQKIRTLDREILKLANKRTSLTIGLLQGKSEDLSGLWDAEADRELWQRLDAANTGPLTAQAVKGVYRELLSAARSKVKTVRVAYLGPAFSFTHLAAIERFGRSADLVPVNSIASVFEEVNRGHCDYGLVPIENSTDGRIVDTLDMFTRLPLRICGEVQMSIHHNLLSRSQRSEIVEIYSKPQALSQCRDWLTRNMPQARLIDVTSTSTAAALARDKPGAGAVASRQAAIQYDLPIVAERIEDNANNITRFAVIGDEPTRSSGKDRTALLLQISHKPGSLSDALQAFKKSKINLTWIESFPMRGPEPGYLFFLDFEGHIDDARIKRALEELQPYAVRLSVLGSYPRSEPTE